MTGLRWLRQFSQRWFSSRSQATRRTVRLSSARTSRRARLALETLEDRFLLSATIADLGTLPGGNYSYAYGLNDSGQVVGYSTRSGGYYHAFLSSNGVITDLGTLTGGTTSFAYGINTSRQVAGTSSTSSSDHAFLYSNGQLIDLGTLTGGTASDASGINSSGQVIGESLTTGGHEHAFLYSNGQMTDLGTLNGYTASDALAINGSGQIVGNLSNANATHAFLYSNGQMTDLGTLGGTFSSANSINASGQVVGNSYINTGDQHAFLYNNGKMTDLGTLGGATSGASSIDDAGQIVGESYTSGGKQHAFLYSNGQMIDLNNLLPTNSGWVLTDATAINNSNQIVGAGTFNGQTHAFVMTLSSAPSIAGTLGGQTVTTGQTVTFTASAVGTPAPTVQWQVSSDGGKTFTNITGATNTTLTLYDVQASLNGNEYQAVFTNSAGSATTSAATLSVDFAPRLTANPMDQTVVAGQNVTFLAGAVGNPAATVQWQVSTDGGKTFTNISGATSNLLTLDNVTTAMSGHQYQAVFTNSVGSTTTRAARLTVNAPPPAPPSTPSAPQLNVPPLLSMFNSFLAGKITVNSDGTATITGSLFGFPLLVSNFDSAGNLQSVLLFGMNVTSLFEMS